MTRPPGLSSIRPGAWVAVDTNVIVFANQGKSSECVEFLRRCASGELQGIVPSPMAAELAHALMLIEARENSWLERGNPARTLAARPDLVRRLVRYEIQMREFFAMGLRIEPARPAVGDRAVPARAGAHVAHDEERRGAAGEALAAVGTARLVAHGVQTAARHHRADVVQLAESQLALADPGRQLD